MVTFKENLKQRCLAAVRLKNRKGGFALRGYSFLQAVEEREKKARC